MITNLLAYMVMSGVPNLEYHLLSLQDDKSWTPLDPVALARFALAGRQIIPKLSTIDDKEFVVKFLAKTRPNSWQDPVEHWKVMHEMGYVIETIETQVGRRIKTLPRNEPVFAIYFYDHSEKKWQSLNGLSVEAKFLKIDNKLAQRLLKARPGYVPK
jgi:hypothetical protein